MPLSLAMEDSEFDNVGGSGSGGGLVAVAAAAAVDNDKTMTKADDRQRYNNQLTMGAAKVGETT